VGFTNLQHLETPATGRADLMSVNKYASVRHLGSTRDLVMGVQW
jgi:hypothetical protein